MSESKIDRPDWNFTNDKSVTTPLPDSQVPVVQPNYVVEGEGLQDLVDYVTQDEPEVDPLVGMTNEQLTMAQGAATMILETCPVDEEWMAAQVDLLPAAVQGKIYRVLASHPHLRGEDLIVKIEDTLSLQETIDAKKWASYLPAEVRDWLLRG